MYCTVFSFSESFYKPQITDSAGNVTMKGNVTQQKFCYVHYTIAALKVNIKHERNKVTLHVL